MGRNEKTRGLSRGALGCVLVLRPTAPRSAGRGDGPGHEGAGTGAPRLISFPFFIVCPCRAVAAAARHGDGLLDGAGERTKTEHGGTSPMFKSAAEAAPQWSKIRDNARVCKLSLESTPSKSV